LLKVTTGELYIVIAQSVSKSRA